MDEDGVDGAITICEEEADPARFGVEGGGADVPLVFTSDKDPPSTDDVGPLNHPHPFPATSESLVATIIPYGEVALKQWRR